MKIIGVEDSKGVFENRPYHNVNFYGTIPVNSNKGAGLKPKKVKVKLSVLSESFGRMMEVKDIITFMGAELDFDYDEYQNVKRVHVVESSANSQTSQNLKIAKG